MSETESENCFCSSSSSDLESEYDSNSTSDDNLPAQIQPYMFEPRRAVVDRPNEEEENMDAEEDNDYRLGNLDW